MTCLHAFLVTNGTFHIPLIMGVLLFSWFLPSFLFIDVSSQISLTVSPDSLSVPTTVNLVAEGHSDA